MFKYENSGAFVNGSIDYPFNITDANDKFVNDFKKVIDKLIEEVNNDSLSKMRYIWIDAGNYCQTEIFLKKILINMHEHYPILYLHCIDFISDQRSLYYHLSKAQINGEYFINNPENAKICVIDHAETIDQKREYFELCKKLHKNKCIFIFVSKNETARSSDWKEIVRTASREEDDNDCYLGIIRSEKNYFIVKPYSHAQCTKIFENAIIKKDIRDKAVSLANTLGDQLRKPYYLDFLIEELNSYNDASEIPTKLDDTELILNIFGKSLDGIIAHLKGFTSLQEYLNGYYDSSFVKTYHYGENSRVPFDNYVWAYGIMYISGKNRCSYAELVSQQFNYTNSETKIDFNGQHVEIIERIVLLFYSKKIKDCDFSLKEYLLQMIEHDIIASLICATVLNKCFDKIDYDTRETVFQSLAKRYSRKLKLKSNIRVHYLLGIELGKMIARISNNSIEQGLEHIFVSVNDDYVEPRSNDKGIAVIPVTNFEFEKFVKDNGYTYYSLNSDKPLNRVAAEYYKEIFDFIISALNGKNRRDCNCLSRLLKGYGWSHYKQIAYLFSRKNDITNEAIYESIVFNYPDEISRPAKWTNSKALDGSQPFCNPLQPVVCVNIFEARAYAKWLSGKVNKPVRLLIYDPDYLSVVGCSEDDDLRQAFISHINKSRDFINSVENGALFYGENDIKVKEPAPVGMPNSQYLGLFDFVGNIFETQDTTFTYNYVMNDDFAKKELNKIQDVFIDYNCPGGGLQRTAANWPPEYMGQVPAFLRNQDIGFRIVIGTSEIGLQHHTYRKLENTGYSEKSTIEFFTQSNLKNIRILDNIRLDYTKSDEEFDNNFSRSKVFCCNEKEAVIYAHNNESCRESILLIQDGYSIYAYHLINITCVQNSDCCNTEYLKMVVRKPVIPSNLATRRNLQNRSCCDWIDILELVKNNQTYIYTAYPINISNGYFKIAKRTIKSHVRNGEAHKMCSLLSNEYLIHFDGKSQDVKKSYYESLKEKLGADFFLPDWIDIVDYINDICNNMSSSISLDIETVMAAISTIDTSDLHEQINKRILSAKRRVNDE